MPLRWAHKGKHFLPITLPPALVGLGYLSVDAMDGQWRMRTFNSATLFGGDRPVSFFPSFVSVALLRLTRPGRAFSSLFFSLNGLIRAALTLFLTKPQNPAQSARIFVPPVVVRFTTHLFPALPPTNSQCLRHPCCPLVTSRRLASDS